MGSGVLGFRGSGVPGFRGSGFWGLVPRSLDQFLPGGLLLRYLISFVIAPRDRLAYEHTSRISSGVANPEPRTSDMCSMISVSELLAISRNLANSFGRYR